MKIKISSLMLVTALLSSLTSLTAAAQSTAVPHSVQNPMQKTETEEDFQHWLMDFKQQALRAGISKSTLKIAFKNIHLNHKVLKSDRRQPEFSNTFFEYFNRAVSKNRITHGQDNLKKYSSLLNAVTQKYGVPGRFIIAFWGMETNYGRYTGNIPIIESLATLAYDPRRTQFFSQQLMDALTIIDQNKLNPAQMKGSWAGAMGQCQFMPFNYLKYGVDGDGDGKINLWDSLPDALYSAGNFLQQLGWQKGKTWGREVQLPKGFNLALADGSTLRNLKDWRDLGLKQPNGWPLPNENMQAKLLLPSDYRGPAFLIYDNFVVIKRWNNSNNYALAVGHLADRIIGKPPLSKTQPSDDKGLARDQIKQIQTLLNSLGYSAGKADGVAGSNTRNALRKFQLSQKIPPDGYPSLRMLDFLKQAVLKQP